jgi:ATP-dependent DNA ligase
MSLTDLDMVIENMREGGRIDKKTEVLQIVNDWSSDEWMAALRFLSGTYTSVGVGTRTVVNAVEQYGLVDDFAERVDAVGTATEVLREADVGEVATLLSTNDDVLTHCAELDTAIRKEIAPSSGDYLTGAVGRLIARTTEPHLVAHALLDDWQTGVSHTTIANAVGEDAGATQQEIERARALEQDSVAFVATAKNGGLTDLLTPEAGQSFKPMKAKSESHLDKLMDRQTAVYAEPKFDGYRLLLHGNDGDVSAYTYRLTDVTASLPEIDTVDWPDGEWILDGEVMAKDGTYNTTTSLVGSDQERSLDDDGGLVKFHAFDAIMLPDAGDISQRAYEHRRDLLVNFIVEVGHEFVFPVRTFGFLPEETEPVEQALQYAEERGHEGVIVKDGASTYQFGKRSQSWVKIKNTAATVDLRISDMRTATPTCGHTGPS